MNRRDFLAVLGGSFLFPGLPEFHEQEMVAWWDKNDSMEPWTCDPIQSYVIEPFTGPYFSASQVKNLVTGEVLFSESGWHKR